MAAFLFVVGILSLLGGFVTLGAAKSAMHEIYGATVMTMGAVFMVGGAVVEALKKHAGTVIAEVRRANENQRWDNIETCIQYLAAARKREENSDSA